MSIDPVKERYLREYRIRTGGEKVGKILPSAIACKKMTEYKEHWETHVKNRTHREMVDHVKKQIGASKMETRRPNLLGLDTNIQDLNSDVSGTVGDPSADPEIRPGCWSGSYSPAWSNPERVRRPQPRRFSSKSPRPQPTRTNAPQKMNYSFATLEHK
jgi:hypothetical protein